MADEGVADRFVSGFGEDEEGVAILQPALVLAATNAPGIAGLAAWGALAEVRRDRRVMRLQRIPERFDHVELGDGIGIAQNGSPVLHGRILTSSRGRQRSSTRR